MDSALLHKLIGAMMLRGGAERQPIMDGLVHWWDSEGQSGNIWTPKVGNVPITTSNSWEDGYFKKITNNTCETSYFNVDFSNGCTVDILYQQKARPNADTQLWAINNQGNQEWVLHYTKYSDLHQSSFYSPTLLKGTPRYGNKIIPLNKFVSDVFTYDGNSTFESYLNKENVVFSDNSVNKSIPTSIKFALKRLTSGLNNQTSLVKSIRIYNRALTQEEINHNREYDEYILNFAGKYLTYQSGSISTYTSLGAWGNYSKIVLDCSCDNPTNTDVLFGRTAVTGFVGYNNGNDLSYWSPASGNLIPNLTATQKGDGKRRVVTYNITSTGTSGDVTIGTYSMGSYTVARKLYGFQAYNKAGELVIDAEPREFSTGGNWFNKVTNEFLPLNGDPYIIGE